VKRHAQQVHVAEPRELPAKHAPHVPDRQERPAEIDHIAPGRRLSRSAATTEQPQTRLPAPHITSVEPPIGFGRESAHLEKMIREAREGRSAVVGLHGLPGSGKSHLVESMIAQAWGLTVVRLPVRSESDVADSAWVKAFQRAEALGSDCQASNGSRVDQLQQSVENALRATCRRSGSPTLLVFEDCPESQKPLAEMLASAVLNPEPDVTALLVLTWRDNPDGTTLSFTQPAFPTHKLQPLTLEQSVEYLLRRTGMTPEPSVLSELWRSTGGIPAAMLSACSHLTDEELRGLIPFPDPVPIGADVASAYGEWAENLEPDARDAVTVAATACMPRPVLEDALQHIGLTIQALRPALDVGALSILGDRVEFSHPLTRAAVFHQSSSRSQIAARRAVARAYARVGLTERAALHAGLSSTQRDDEVARLCMQAAQMALQRSNLEVAAQCEAFGAQFAQNPEEAARHLIRASSLWQSAGQPERAMECLGRVTPVSSSTSVMGQAAYRAGRIAFSTEASTHAASQMATGAESCTADAPGDAVEMLADAAASAALLDQTDDAVRYARRAVELAGAESGPAARLALVTLSAVRALISDGETTAGHQDDLVRFMDAVQHFPGSAQLAYVIGSYVVQTASPVLVRRWFAWANGSGGMAEDRLFAAAMAMVRTKEQIAAGRVTDAVVAAERAVRLFDDLHDLPLLARALGWSAWAQATAGEATRAFASATRFFSLEQAMPRSARLQVLAALAHCELQRGHVDRAAAWLRAVDEESVTQNGSQGYVDWPLLPVSLQLSLLAGYAPETMGMVTATGSPSEEEEKGTDHLWAWTDALRASDPTASLQLLDEALLSGPPRDPLLTAQMKLTAALRQRQLLLAEVARFNFTQAIDQFERCEARGWSKLAASQRDSSSLLSNGSASSLPGDAAPIALAHTAQFVPATRTPPVESTDAPGSGPSPTHEIRLLGQFSVLRNGTPAPVPLGHAAQALKVVALFGQISVDELAELLWPGAEPGVGTRRLRNILWRIKSSSGDLLRRNDNFICLEEGVITDVAVFEQAAGRAFKEQLSPDSAHSLARDAIRLYGGELLPSDRYADWTTGPREALTQLRLQLLDLMLAHAFDSGNRQEALALLEDLIEADPYEERYYIELATLHLEAGNVSRMRASIARCERMLADLGVQPSRQFLDFVRDLQQN
jgi:DNA-binding SARP family transcriptional activator